WSSRDHQKWIWRGDPPRPYLAAVRALRGSAYPVVAIGGTALAGVAIGAGLPVGPVILASSVAAAILVALLERLIPFRSEWNQSRDDVSTAAIHLLVSSAVVEIGRGLVAALFALASSWAGARFGIEAWPIAWPLALQVALAILLGDVLFYWFHRTQ